MSRQNPNGYYQILGVTPEASAQEIARAFRTLAKACHPDRNPDPGAAARFQALSEAYAVLSASKGREAFGGPQPRQADRSAGRAAKLASQLGLGVGAPAIAVMLYLQGQALGLFGAPASGPTAPAAAAPQQAKAQPSARETPLPMVTCARPPHDGALIEGEVATGPFGHHLEITNGADGSAIVKLRDVHTGRARLAVFVAKGGHARVGPLPDGDYHLQYALGAALAEDCRSLTAIDRAAEFPDADSLRTQYREGAVVTQTLSYVLYAAPNGNVRAQTIDPQRFLAE